jgi:hypothetical protein
VVQRHSIRHLGGVVGQRTACQNDVVMQPRSTRLEILVLVT